MSTEPPPPAALVTGGAIRLGRAIALALAARGYAIALHFNRSEAAAEETAAEIRQAGGTCEPFQADLSAAEAPQGLVEMARARFPGLGVLVNSASGYTQATLMETTPEIFDQQIALNLRAPFFLTQAFARVCGAGNVINILDNKIGFNQYHYAAYLLSKKALGELTRMAAVELAPVIRVNAIAPGVVLPAETRSAAYLAWRTQGIPLKRRGEAEHITSALLALLDNPFVTGQILVVDGGESVATVGQNAGSYGGE